MDGSGMRDVVLEVALKQQGETLTAPLMAALEKQAERVRGRLQ